MTPAPVRPRLEPLDRRDVPAVTVPDLSSNPGAPFTLYLDFDGATVSEWGDFTPGRVPAFDTDGEVNNTSPAELTAMELVWQHVAEDYAPFGVNVTTRAATPRRGEGVRVVIGGSADDWYGEPAFGVAYRGDFSAAAYPKAFVFSEDILGSGWKGAWLPKVVGDAAAHEAGHVFGLRHQARYGYTGFGEPWVRTAAYTPVFTDPGGNPRGALMGTSYTARSTWWNGPGDHGEKVAFPVAQDDMAVLGSVLGWRADEPTRNLGVVVPGRTPTAAGVIGTTADGDNFLFVHYGGPLTIDVKTLLEGDPAAPLVGNLDARVTVIAIGSRGGQYPIASFDPAATTGVSAVAGLPAPGVHVSGTAETLTGNYFLRVGSHGTYGDVGQYTVKLTYGIPAASVRLEAPAASPAFVRTESRPAVRIEPAAAPAAGSAPHAEAAAGPAVFPDDRVVVRAAADELFPVPHGTALQPRR